MFVRAVRKPGSEEPDSEGDGAVVWTCDYGSGSTEESVLPASALTQYVRGGLDLGNWYRWGELREKLVDLDVPSTGGTWTSIELDHVGTDDRFTTKIEIREARAMQMICRAAVHHLDLQKDAHDLWVRIE